ncbi:MAG: ice-binding family protein [Candidatus Paceibacterota bacterium]
MNIIIKKLNKAPVIVLAFAIAFVFTLIGFNTTLSATDPGLGAAENFSVLGQTAITGSGTISENVGLNSTGAGITALTPAMVGGTIYSTDGIAPSTAILDPSVQADASTAFTTSIPSQTSDGSIGPILDGLTVESGVWDIGAGRLNGGILTLDGPGTYILRASSDLVSSGSINLINGARACDVYWRVETLATINGSSFVGSILAGTGIHFGDSVTLDGRALAIGGDVTFLNNVISGPGCATSPLVEEVTTLEEVATLNVIKAMINDDGGTSTADEFTINVTGDNVSLTSFSGSKDGVEVTLDAGDYSVVETDGPSGYLTSYSNGCSGTITVDETKTCTITNNDIATETIIDSNITPELIDNEASPVPKFPDTGIGPNEKSIPWNLVVLTGISVTLGLFYFMQRRQDI